jgi:hypothetical protein
LWVGTYQGMEDFNTSSYSTSTYFDLNNVYSNDGGAAVYSLLPDHCGNLWIGGAFGVVRLHLLNNRFTTDNFLNAPSLNISSFLQLNNRNILVSNYTVYIESVRQNNVLEFLGTRLINKYDYPRSKETLLFPIRKLEMNKAGKILAFSGGGIRIADTVSKKFKPLPITLVTSGENTKDFKCDFSTVVKWNDSIYYGCRRTTAELGFIKININSQTATQYKLGPFLNQQQPISNSIHFLYKDVYDRLWCCSDDRGLSIFYPSHQLFEHYYSVANNKSSLPTNFIRCVYQTSDSMFWISTNAGLCRTKALPGTKAVFDVVIPDVECNYLVEDGKGNLWVNSKNGNYRLNPKTLRWHFFGKTDGYYWDPFYGKKFLLKDGSFLMPDGYMIDPSIIPSNKYQPKSFLSSIKVYNNEFKSDTAFPLKKIIYLKNYENFISINYSCDNYINEEQNSYAYKLEGIDKRWVYVDNRTTAYYTQLPPGKYQFFVKAANNDGLEGPAMQLITIVIIPAWYQTWWFKTLCILAVISIVYIFYRQKINQEKAKGLAQSSKAELKQVKAEFEKQIAETEMVALRAQMNPHFIFNVLNSINKYILENDSEKASHYLTQFSRLIRQVLENSKSQKVSLEADLQALKLYIDLEKLRFGDKFSYTINVAENIDSKFVQFPSLLIQPYVENAIWHGLMQKAENGHLNITITQLQENLLQVIIEDDGIGRQKAAELKSKSATKHKSFGMQITRDRIAIVNKLFNMHATIQFQDLHSDGLPTGTRVILNIPC